MCASRTMSQGMLRLDGRTYLAPPSGPLVVGCVDLMSSSVMMRCFYPCSSRGSLLRQNTSRWPKWLPANEYMQGYIRFKLSLNRLLPFLDRFGTWLIHDPYCSNLFNEPLLSGNTDTKWPVVVFSHGMGGCRTTYTGLLTELASHGYFVAAIEHRDGSGGATLALDPETKSTVTGYVFAERLQPGQDEYEFRSRQVNIRVEECCEAVRLIQQLNQGQDLSVAWIEKPDRRVLDSFKGALDLTKPVVAGHSLGGVTTVKALTSTSTFQFGVALDPWLHPIAREVKELRAACSLPLERLFFLNCEKFQDERNLKLLHPFDCGSNVLTIKDAIHYAPTDLPTIFTGSYANLPFWLFGLHGGNPHGLNDLEALDLFKQMFIAFLKTNVGPDQPGNNAFQNSIQENSEHLIRGSFYLGNPTD